MVEVVAGAGVGTATSGSLAQPASAVPARSMLAMNVCARDLIP
jgi:hypothetical protein